MPDRRPVPAPASPERRHFWLIAVGIVALIVALRVGGLHLPRFASWVDSFGVWGPVVYVAGYVVATVALVPGALMTLAAGAIFGLGWGTVLAFTGETLGGVAAFLIARYLVRPTVARHLATSVRFAAIDRAVAAKGGRIVFLFRLSPLIPFNFLNYALGVTNVRFVDYLLASIGMLPGAFLYVYYGKLTGDVAALAAGAAPPRGPEYYAMLALGLSATLAAATIVTRTAQRALREATDAS
jgi:uncharacterized membrane protein YdjX (TVP38/TMEM64 family)